MLNKLKHHKKIADILSKKTLEQFEFSNSLKMFQLISYREKAVTDHLIKFHFEVSMKDPDT